MDTVNIIKRYLTYLKPFRKKLFALLALALLQTGFSSAAPYLAKPMIDSSYSGRGLKPVIMFGLAGFALYLTGALLSFVYRIQSQKTKNEICVKAARDYNNRLYDMSLGFFRKKTIGSRIFSLNADLPPIGNVVISSISDLVLNGLKLLLFFALVASISWQFVVPMLAMALFSVAKFKYFSKRSLEKHKAHIAALRAITQQQTDVLPKMFLVKTSAAENFEKKRYLNAFSEKLKINFNIMKLHAVNGIISDVSTKVLMGTAGVYGIFLIQNHAITIGGLSVFVLYFGMFAGALNSVIFQSEHLVSSDTLYIKRFFDTLDTKCEITDSPRATYIKEAKGNITVKNLFFSYNSGTAIVLEDSNMNIRAGQWSLLAGPSGCGKTTLINLILRLYNPQKGAIFIDNININDIKIQSLRENIALVGQDIMLFSGSVAYNIAYGAKDMTTNDLIRACEISGIYGAILKLPKGFDTEVGDNAFRFSGGQKQRLSLARAIIRQPRILILDEALSNVDIDTEMKIYQALKKTRAGLTTIIVSQRPSTREVADDVFKMNAGGEITAAEKPLACAS